MKNSVKKYLIVLIVVFFLFSNIYAFADKEVYSPESGDSEYTRDLTGDEELFFMSGGENSLPITTTPEISPSRPNKTNDLNCSFKITDSDANQDLSANITWYKNNNSYLDAVKENIVGGETAYHILKSGNTSASEDWKCRVIPYDGAEYGEPENSSPVTINSAPEVSLDSPEDGNSLIDRTPEFSWTGTDAEGDSLTYEINITCSPGCSDDNRYESDMSQESYVPSEDLQYLEDNNYYYEWKVRAYDGSLYSDWSEERNFSIKSVVKISLPNNVSDFGPMGNGERDNTTDNDPSPLVIQNDGNAFTNISLEGTSLWEAVSLPNDYYKYKISEKEPGSYNSSKSKTSWTKMTGSAVTSIVELDYSNEKDTAETEFDVEVPSNESGGSKSSTITFTASLGE